MERYAIIDPRLPKVIITNLQREGFSIIPVPLTELTALPLSGHPDIQMFTHEKNIFVHPDIDLSFIKKIEKIANIIICKTKLGKDYPRDIPYNIACTGHMAIHRQESTDETILQYFLQNGVTVINAAQGYSKCSTLIVDDTSLITADKNIHLSAKSFGLDSLLVSRGHIDLPGYNYGFIGGASGKFLDTIYLTGTIDKHPDKDMIHQFIESKNMKIKILSDQKIIDSGSIFFIS